MEKARLENVDIIDVLQFIVDNNTSNYIADFEYDKMTLLNFKRESKNFLWMSRDNGTWIFPKNEVFFTGTAAFNTWTSYSVKNDSIKAFMVEVERVSDGRVYGTTSNGITFEKDLPAGTYSKLEFYYYTNHQCMYQKSNITYTVEYYFE